MTSRSSDFVLDEGLDDDEDMLTFHVQRNVESEPKPDWNQSSENSPESTDECATNSETIQSGAKEGKEQHSEAEKSSIIIDGLPLTASRADLNTLLPDPKTIIHIRLRRLESYGLLRILVEFASPGAAAEALLLDGTDYYGSALSVKPGSLERWAATAARCAQQQQTNLWGSLGAMAERLEAGARKISEELENRLHVSERVAGTASVIKQADRQYGVSEKIAGITHAGMETAKGVDRQYGISDGVGRVVGNVNNAAKVVAGEVDENFRVGDRAREAANAVMKNETIGPVARALTSGENKSKKNYQPRASVPEEEEASSAQDFESVAADGSIAEASNKVEVGE